LNQRPSELRLSPHDPVRRVNVSGQRLLAEHRDAGVQAGVDLFFVGRALGGDEHRVDLGVGNRLNDSAPMEAKPWFCTSTVMILMRSWTAVASSVAIIRYDPSPTITNTSRSGHARRNAEAAGHLIAHAGVDHAHPGVLDRVQRGDVDSSGGRRCWTPPNSFCSTPWDSEYCAPRNFTTACATVSLMINGSSVSLGSNDWSVQLALPSPAQVGR
jgi:hypothetical protein